MYVKRRSKKLQSGDFVERYYLATINDQLEIEDLISSVILEDQSDNRDYFEITEPQDSMLTSDYVLLLYDRNDDDITDVSLYKVMVERIVEREIHYRHHPEVHERAVSIVFF